MQKIRIDFDNPGLPQHISAVENDSQSRFFQATLYENGKAYTAPEGATYSIMYRGFGPQNQGWYDTINDGAGKRAACAVSGNVVTCEIARQALQVPGHVSIVLCVTTGKGYMVKSWPIECDCKNDRYDSTAEIQSFFYITQVSNADWNRAIQALEELKNIIDPTLSLSGKAADAKVTGDKIGEIKEDKVNKPSVTDDGKIPRAKNGEVEWVEAGQPTDEQTNNAVESWLNQHPEATTTVQDGSIEEIKINKNFLSWIKKDYVTPEMFGAKGDANYLNPNDHKWYVDSTYTQESNNDTQAITKALQYCKDNNKELYCNASYYIDSIFVYDGVYVRGNKPANMVYSNHSDTYVYTKPTFAVKGTINLYRSSSIDDCLIIGSGTNKLITLFGEVYRVNIFRCTFSNCVSAIDATNISDGWNGENTIDSCFFSGCLSYAIDIGGKSLGDSSIRNCVALGNAYGFVNNFITGFFQGNHDYSANGSNFKDSVIITGNYFDGVNLLKYHNNNSMGASITGNFFWMEKKGTEGDKFCAILIDGKYCRNVTICGNVIKPSSNEESRADYYLLGANDIGNSNRARIEMCKITGNSIIPPNNLRSDDYVWWDNLTFETGSHSLTNVFDFPIFNLSKVNTSIVKHIYYETYCGGCGATIICEGTIASDSHVVNINIPDNDSAHMLTVQTINTTTSPNDISTQNYGNVKKLDVKVGDSTKSYASYTISINIRYSVQENYS